MSTPVAAAFQVSPATASFLAFQDQAIDDNSNGLTDRIVTTATLNIAAAGKYRLHMYLKAGNGKSLLASTAATLPAGGAQMSLTFPAKEIVALLGAGGPYEKTNAVLVYEKANGDDIIADERDTVGPTPNWPLSSLDRGDLYLTGQNSAAGVITGPGAQLDILRVTIGVHYTPGGKCVWSGSLYDSTDSIDYANGSGVLTPGVNSIALDFLGPKISLAGRNGPYQVGKFGIQCSGLSARANSLLTTPAFPAAQFRSSAAAVTLSASPASLSLAAGKSSMIEVSANSSTRGVVPLANATVTGLPTGLSVDIQPPVLFETPGSWVVHFRALPSTVAGAHQPQFRVTDPAGIVRLLTIPVTVTAQTGQSVATSPPGLNFLVNGLSYSQPESFQWAAGSTVTLSVPSPQQLPESHYTFVNWSDGGAMTHSVTAPAGNASYIANFNAQYMLRVRANPPDGGSVTPATDSLHPANTPIPVTAVPNPGYSFTGWGASPVAQGAITLSGPTKLTAFFTPTAPPSLSWSIAGKAGPTLARMWTLSVRNNGPGAIFGAMLMQLSLTQTAGPPCTPVVESKFPLHVGSPDPGASVSVTLFLKSSCAAGALFQVNGVLQVNGGTSVNLTLPGQSL
ncbi:MAG: hypothetical protein JNK48_10300 [Bryobacterales bacterium]|nr:hypothetical protein [Bryobacterales bacterium]